ncbi:MAG: tetratricopeptide repeat protein [Candidatus Zeuxoniibacter abyssi]|nr:MAG: tetratricopeptide repeat protein [Candidatus Persebacteraceae bacterium AB1(2)]
MTYSRKLVLILVAVSVFAGAPVWADDVTVLCSQYFKDKDYKNAFAPCKQSAELGYAGAQFNLAWMYYESEGVEQDKRKALKWVRKAAEQGSLEAQFFLGLMYAKGEGVGQNYKEAYIWFSLAALLGNGNEIPIKARDKAG